MTKRTRRGDPQKQAYWEAVVRRWREGGESVRAFCRAEGLRESAFYFWRRMLARRGQLNTNRGPAAASGVRLKARSARPAFLPMHVVTRASERAGVAETGYPLAGCGVEIILAQGCAVRVQAGFDRQTLADVLAVLEARPC
jgi:transposase-like protein